MLIKQTRTEKIEKMVEISLPLFIKSKNKREPDFYFITENQILHVACHKEMIYKTNPSPSFNDRVGELIGECIQIEESEFLAAYVTAKANLDYPLLQTF